MLTKRRLYPVPSDPEVKPITRTLREGLNKSQQKIWDYKAKKGLRMKGH